MGFNENNSYSKNSKCLLADSWIFCRGICLRSRKAGGVIPVGAGKPTPAGDAALGRLDLSDELGLELHRADAVDLAVDVVVAIAQADVLDLGADLDHQGGALDLQVLDHGDGVAVL